MSIMSQSLFVYGTLMAPEVMKTLLGRLPPHTPALIRGFTRHPVRDQVFPGMIPTSSNKQDSTVVKGILFTELNDREMKRLDWFEDVEYIRTDVSVECDGISQKTQTYVWRADLVANLDLEKEWSYESFRHEKLNWYLEHTVRSCQEELDRRGL